MQLTILRVCVLVAGLCLVASQSSAQIVPSAAVPSPEPSGPPAPVENVGRFDEQTRWLINSEIGTNAGLGFRLPHAAFGTTIEKPLSRRLEIQASAQFSPGRKLITNNGRSLGISAKAIVWANHYFGLTSDVAYGRLWTSEFNKTAYFPAPGVVFRLRFLGDPTRMYLDYVIPTGRIDNHGIESSRLQGPEYYVESRMASIGPLTIRVGLKLSVYHFLEQGDPLCDGTFGGPVTCRRTGHTTGTAAFTLRFERVRHVSDALY